MKTGFITVPFKAETSSGFSEAQGVAKFSNAGIVIEYESKILGLFGGDVKEVRVSPDELLDFKFRKGLWRFFASIQLRFKNVGKLHQLPNEGGKVKLNIKREDFYLAENAANFFMTVLNPGASDLPPAQTPVAELFEGEGDKYKTNDLKETQKLK